MKKILLTALLVSATAGAFAQGVVQFRGYWSATSPVVDARVSNGLTGALLDSSNTLWRTALIGGPTTASAAIVDAGPLGTAGTLGMMYNPTATTLTWVNFASGTSAPNLSGIPRVGLQAARAVPGVDWGGTALVQMVAWQGNYTTWADAFAAWKAGTADVLIGASNPLTLKLPTSATDQNLTYLWNLNSFSIVPVPEPTTFALAGLGAAALLIFRRRS